MEKVIEIDYSPRECFQAYHDTEKRYSVTIAHRRAGKTVARINKLIREAATCTKQNPRFGYMAPYYIQAKDIAWAYLKYYAAPITALGGKVNESELSITFAHNNANIRLYGAENAERLRGLYFDGICADEAQDIPPYVLTQIIYPALADRQGWLDLSGTPKGWGNLLGETFKLARTDSEWFVQVLKASDTNIIPQEELDRLKRAMSDNEYAQEFECSFDAAIVGSYYGDLLREAEAQGRVTAVPHEPMLRVNTAWDLGMSDDTAIWFYQVSPAGQVRMIDYLENNGVGLDWYVKQIEERARANNWTMGEYVLPHDVQVRELGTGKSRFEMLQMMGIQPTVAPKLSIDDGINAVRMAMPKMWFNNSEAVLNAVELIKQYRREYDQKRQVFYDRPLHNFASHACLDGDSLIETRRGKVAIRDVVAGDYALTPAGYALVTASGETKKTRDLIEITLTNGERLIATPEHKVFTTRGVVHADALRYNDVVYNVGEAPCLSYQKIRSAGYRDAFTESFKASGIGIGLTENTTVLRLVGVCGFFIERFIALCMATRHGMLSLWMETSPTLTPQIGQSFVMLESESIQFKKLTGSASTTNQRAITKPITQGIAASRCTGTSGKSTTAKSRRAFTFTTKTATRLTTTFQTLKCYLLPNIVATMQKIVIGMEARKTNGGLPLLVNLQRLGTAVQRGLLGIKNMVKKRGRTSQDTLLNVSSAEKSTKPHFQLGQSSATKIAKLRRLDCEESRPVYDLTVEHHHCYFANGVLVSNCDSLRYLAVSLRESSSSAPLRRALKGIV